MTAVALAGNLAPAAMSLVVQSLQILVIGYGNPGRQDDGLGPAAAAEIEKLGWPNVTTSDNYQLVIEDAVQIAAHDVIWFVDATREGEKPCALQGLSPAFDITFTSHLLKPETLLAIADQQFGVSPEAYLVSIRGYEFDFLEGLTDRASTNLALAVTLMRRRISHLRKGLERDILSKNDAYAEANRARLMAAGQFALNFVSSPGSGKTSLLVRTITDLRSRFPIAVIEGDQQTSNDADRIRATGAPAIQINTGKGCHLDAHMVGHALDHPPLPPGGLLFIENVGNLVCPAAFDLGEAHKVVMLSVTEGEDKPLKYPDMFAQADLMLLNKADLLPHLDFDVEACLAFARRVNPQIDILTVSARTGDAMLAFYHWIEERARSASQNVSYVPG